MFPSNLSTADGEKLGLVMTPAMMSADIYAIVRSHDRDSFFGKEKVTVAVQEHNPNLDAVMLDHFPGWKAVRCPDLTTVIIIHGAWTSFPSMPNHMRRRAEAVSW